MTVCQKKTRNGSVRIYSRRKDFLAESVRTIQGYFEKAREVGEGDSGGDVNEGLSGKVNEKMEK